MSIVYIQQGDGTAFIFKEEPCVFTFSVHCGKNFPLCKQQSDLDISVEDGLEDKEYLSTGRLKWHRLTIYSVCIQTQPEVLELIILVIHSGGSPSLATGHLPPRSGAVRRRCGPSSGGRARKALSDWRRWAGYWQEPPCTNISESLVHFRAVSERSVCDADCSEERCSCCHGYWRRILQRRGQTGSQTFHCPQSSSTGKIKNDFKKNFKAEKLNKEICQCFRFGRSVACKTFIQWSPPEDLKLLNNLWDFCD